MFYEVLCHHSVDHEYHANSLDAIQRWTKGLVIASGSTCDIKDSARLNWISPDLISTLGNKYKSL